MFGRGFGIGRECKVQDLTLDSSAPEDAMAAKERTK